jgi:FAD binding domain
MSPLPSNLLEGLVALESKGHSLGLGLHQRAQLAPMPAQGAGVAPGGQPIGVDCITNESWGNYGQNLSVQNVARRYYVWNDPGNGTSDWHAGLANLQWVIQNAERNGYRLRPVGSAWSFSPCAATADTLVDIRALSLPMPALQTTDLVSMDPGRLVHVQCGMTVDRINHVLEAAGETLWTMGGNAGQTIAGALATGTHGSFWQRPPTADYVRAITLVTESGRAVWLEPSSRPLTQPTFTAWGAFQVVRDDAQFQAAVVSLGCLGIVFSLVVEIRPIIYLDFTRSHRDFDSAVQKALYDNDLSGLGVPGLPDHFEVALNPYALGPGQNGAHVTLCFEKPATGSQIIPPPGPSLNDGTLAKLVQFIVSNPSNVPIAMGPVMDLIYPDRHALGPFSVAIPLSTTDAPTFSAEIAFQSGDLKTVLPAILQGISNAQPGFYFPGALGIRFMQRSNLPLAFTHFDPTCTIEFACMGGVAGTDAFLKNLFADLTKAGVVFTPHWGQFFDPQAAVAQGYGPALANWLAARKMLLPQQRRTFGNPFTDALGLS